MQRAPGKIESISPEELGALLMYVPWTGKFYWRASGKEALCQLMPNGYLAGTVKGFMCYAHRAAWALWAGWWPADEIDHGLNPKHDNRVSSLRLATRHQNMRYRRSRKGVHTSSYLGVYWSKDKKKWTADASLNNKTIHLGRYNSEKEAALTYDVFVLQQAGNFAMLNFPL